MEIISMSAFRNSMRSGSGSRGEKCTKYGSIPAFFILINLSEVLVVPFTAYPLSNKLIPKGNPNHPHPNKLTILLFLIRSYAKIQALNFNLFLALSLNLILQKIKYNH